MSLMSTIFPEPRRCGLCHAIMTKSGHQKHREGCPRRGPTRRVAYDDVASINVAKRNDRFRAKNTVIGRKGK